jgi:hypothetical protein
MRIKVLGLCLGMALFLGACSASKNKNPAPVMFEKMTEFEIFKGYIVGDFNNSAQVVAEQKAGKQIHPLAVHVNRLFDSKIDNLPPSYKGFYVLEESYYTYPEKSTEVKPYLFWFEPTETGQVRLHSMALPKEIDKTAIRNNNAEFRLDYKTLKESPTFTPAVYTYSERGFYLNHTVEIAPSMQFTLEETIDSQTLTVMETLMKNGVRLTPYSTPILYVRQK